MLATRNVALRANGLRVTKARVHHRGKGLELILTHQVLGELAVTDHFTLELLELLHPPEIRRNLLNGGWRKVSLRILIALLRSAVVHMVQES